MDKNKQRRSSGKVLEGKVVSAKMKNTVVVAVNRFVKHPKYHKYMQITKRYKAHDEGNTKKEGEMVTIVECNPMSKDKHFKVMENGKSKM